MYGLEAISAANGWTIAISGVSIVFIGLLVLAAVMANMERILASWDRRGELLKAFKQKPQEKQAQVREAPQGRPESQTPDKISLRLSQEQIEVADHFRLITKRLGKPFPLPQLLEKATEHGISNPHRHLDTFLKLNLIVEDKDDRRGFYTWASDVQVANSKVGKP